MKAIEFSRIADPDGDGNVWGRVENIDGALGSVRAVLQAPGDGRYRQMGQSEAIYRLRFATAGTYRAYYRLRGFNGETDEIYVRFGFDQAPTSTVWASTRGFEWRPSGNFVVTTADVKSGRSFELRVGVHEFYVRIDAIVLSLDRGLDGPTLDSLVDDPEEFVQPPRANIEVLPGQLVDLVEGSGMVTLDGSGSRNDRCGSDDLRFLWEKLSGPAGDSFGGAVDAASVAVTLRSPGVYRYRLRVESEGGASAVETEVTATAGAGNAFLRCDTDGDGQSSITDAIFSLRILFLGEAEPACRASFDCDSDGTDNLTDPIFFLNYFFLGGTPPAAPYPDCDVAEVEVCAQDTCSM